MFSTLSKTEIIIFVTFNLSSANAFNLDQSKTLSSGNGLKHTTDFKSMESKLKKTFIICQSKGESLAEKTKFKNHVKSKQKNKRPGITGNCPQR